MHYREDADFKPLHNLKSLLSIVFNLTTITLSPVSFLKIIRDASMNELDSDIVLNGGDEAP